MASVTNKNIPTEYAFTGDYFNFRKKFYHPEEDDDYWTAVINESDALIRKYDCNEYLKALVLVCVDDLERRYRAANYGNNPKITFIPGEVVTSVYNRIMNRNKQEESVK